MQRQDHDLLKARPWACVLFLPAFPQAWRQVLGDSIPKHKVPWLRHRDLPFSCHVLVLAIALRVLEKTMSREGFKLARVRWYLGCLRSSLQPPLAMQGLPLCPCLSTHIVCVLRPFHWVLRTTGISAKGGLAISPPSKAFSSLSLLLFHNPFYLLL